MSMSVKEAARLMNVSVRSVHLARELQRCRPDLADRCLAGELTLRQALRLAKPEKYAKRDKVEQWLAAWRAWSPDDQSRALQALAEALDE
jgi:hypothetical protein